MTESGTFTIYKDENKKQIICFLRRLDDGKILMVLLDSTKKYFDTVEDAIPEIKILQSMDVPVGSNSGLNVYFISLSSNESSYDIIAKTEADALETFKNELNGDGSQIKRIGCMDFVDFFKTREALGLMDTIQVVGVSEETPGAEFEKPIEGDTDGIT